jgi:hypothetical protein
LSAVQCLKTGEIEIATNLTSQIPRRCGGDNWRRIRDKKLVADIRVKALATEIDFLYKDEEIGVNP